MAWSKFDNIFVSVIAILLVVLWFDFRRTESYREILRERKTYDETICHPDDPRKLAELETKYPKIYNLNNLRMNEILSNHYSFLDRDADAFRKFEPVPLWNILYDTNILDSDLPYTVSMGANQNCSTATDYTPICKDEKLHQWNF